MVVNTLVHLMIIASHRVGQRTTKKTPQLNGVAERMNRTLLERMGCMLSEAKLPRQDTFGMKHCLLLLM